jgi:hypothetical protein
LKYPFPDFLSDPWFNEITAFFLGVDGTNFATAEDRNLFITGGGVLTFDPVANTLTWSSPILLQTHSVGITWVVQPTTVTIFDGQVLWVQVDRRSLVEDPTPVRNVVPQVTNVLINSDPQKLQDKIVLGFRSGGTFVWRPGIDTSTTGFAASWIMGEVPPEVPNGVVTTFTTANPYVTGKLAVYLDGLRMTPGDDFVEVNATTFQFSTPPQTGSKVLVDYIRQ